MAPKKGTEVVVAVCTLLCFGGLTALWGIFAFSNPDLFIVIEGTDTTNPHCLVKINAQECTELWAPYTMTFDSASASEISIEGIGTDMTQKFLDVFMWAFILALMPLFTVIFMICGTVTETPELESLGAYTMVLHQLGGLVWLIFLCIVRWNAEGAVISGDNWAELAMEPAAATAYDRILMTSSANLMQVWAYVSLLSTACCCMCTLYSTITSDAINSVAHMKAKISTLQETLMPL